MAEKTAAPAPNAWCWLRWQAARALVFSDLSIGVHAALSADHPKIYNHVKITYKIKLAEEDKSKMIKAVSLSTEKYCGVFAMFKTFAKMDTEIDYL